MKISEKVYSYNILFFNYSVILYSSIKEIYFSINVLFARKDNIINIIKKKKIRVKES